MTFGRAMAVRRVQKVFVDSKEIGDGEEILVHRD
jgi:hypothetical protein